MATIKSAARLLRTPINTKNKQGDPSFDNPRRNIDPHIVTKVAEAQEMVVTKLYFDNDKNTYITKNSTTGKVEIWVDGTRKASF